MTRNQKVLLGLGLGAVAIYFISKNMKTRLPAVPPLLNATTPSKQDDCPSGTTFVQPQCITAPCPGMCSDNSSIPDA